ncbi:MAG: VanZ family protein [Acutalibacteraceae bacterium]|nr:VanZ family protein [Acutalibacteraceae bacterium]
MKKTIKTTLVLRVLFTTLTLALTAFIWLHSLASADESSKESEGVLNFLNNFFVGLGMEPVLTDFIVRKLAHFLEFTAYGALLSATYISYTNQLAKNIPNMLFVLLAVPVIDETLQYFSPGRSPQVRDVLIDFSGCITGLIFTALVFAIIKFVKAKKSKAIDSKG